MGRDGFASEITSTLRVVCHSFTATGDAAILREMAPDICPVCGADVPEKARACPECGADEKTGWSEKARYDELGIPDEEDFDYNEFVKREFEGEKPKRKLHFVWVIVAVILVVSFLAYFF